MKIWYDPEIDVLRILFKDEIIEESNESKLRVINDDDNGNVIDMEIVDASKRMDRPSSIEFEIAV